MVTRSVPVRDPLAVIRVGGGRGVVGRRTRFGLWDGARLPTSSEPVGQGCCPAASRSRTAPGRVLMTAEESHLPGRLQHAPQHSTGVVLHLRACGPFVEAVVVAPTCCGRRRAAPSGPGSCGRACAAGRKGRCRTVARPARLLGRRAVRRRRHRHRRVGEGEAARTHAIDEVVGGQPHVTAPLSPRRDTGSHGSSPQERCSG